jgi:hypothetical protein
MPDGDDDEGLHIGKSSGGWVFSIEAHEDRGLVDWPSWHTALKRGAWFIEDEYGKACTLEELTRTVCCRHHPRGLAVEQLPGGGIDDFIRREAGTPTWRVSPYKDFS